MNISKSLLCRLLVTISVTACIGIAGWFTITNFPTIVPPDWDWEKIAGYMATVVLIMMTYAIGVAAWYEEQRGLGSAILLICAIVTSFMPSLSVKEPATADAFIIHLIIIYAVSVWLLFIALWVHELVAKKVCKVMFGGTQD